MIETKIEGLQAELCEVEERLATIERELQAVAFDAETGDAEAVQYRADLLIEQGSGHRQGWGAACSDPGRTASPSRRAGRPGRGKALRGR